MIRYRAAAVGECYALATVADSTTQLVDHGANTLYVYSATKADYKTASAACAALQPVPGIVFKGTLWCIGGFSENVFVESWFKSQNAAGFESYWIGLRQPGVGAGTWSRYAFRWEDGSIPPALNPSSQNYDGAGYSHWGQYLGGGSPDPNNALNQNQQCVAATTTHVVFSYYSGALTRTARSNLANYVQEANSSRNPIGWNDRNCGLSYQYICELVGELDVPLVVGCKQESAGADTPCQRMFPWPDVAVASNRTRQHKSCCPGWRGH